MHRKWLPSWRLICCASSEFEGKFKETKYGTSSINLAQDVTALRNLHSTQIPSHSQPESMVLRYENTMDGFPEKGPIHTLKRLWQNTALVLLTLREPIHVTTVEYGVWKKSCCSGLLPQGAGSARRTTWRTFWNSRITSIIIRWESETCL